MVWKLSSNVKLRPQSWHCWIYQYSHTLVIYLQMSWTALTLSTSVQWPWRDPVHMETSRWWLSKSRTVWFWSWTPLQKSREPNPTKISVQDLPHTPTFLEKSFFNLNSFMVHYYLSYNFLPYLGWPSRPLEKQQTQHRWSSWLNIHQDHSRSGMQPCRGNLNQLLWIRLEILVFIDISWQTGQC